MVGLLLQTKKSDRMKTENGFKQIADSFAGDDADFDGCTEQPAGIERHSILSTKKLTCLISERLVAMDYDTEGNILAEIEKELENFSMAAVETEEEKRLSLEYMAVTQRERRKFSGMKANYIKPHLHGHGYNSLNVQPEGISLAQKVPSLNEPPVEEFYGIEQLYMMRDGAENSVTEKAGRDFVHMAPETAYFLVDPERLYQLASHRTDFYAENDLHIAQTAGNLDPAVYLEAGILYSINKNEPFEYNGQLVMESFILIPHRNYNSIIEMLQGVQITSGGSFNIKTENRELNGDYVPYVVEIAVNENGKEKKYTDGKDGYFLESYVFDRESEEIDIGRFPWHLQPIKAYEPVEIRYGKETDRGCGAGGSRNGKVYKLDMNGMEGVRVNELLDMKPVFGLN